MWSHRRSSLTRLRADVNVTPMIDVMLVLLIIFMIVTPAVTSRAIPPTSRHASTKPGSARKRAEAGRCSGPRTHA